MELTRVTTGILKSAETVTVYGTGYKRNYLPSVWINTGDGYTVWNYAIGYTDTRSYEATREALNELLIEGFVLIANGERE